MSKFKILVLFAFALYLFSAGGDSPFPVPSADGEIFLNRLPPPNTFPLNQGPVGTCVGAGHAGGCNIVTAVEVLLGKRSKFELASIESAYGGAKNEGLQKISHDRSDGANGYACVAWLNKYGGRIFAKDYPNYKINVASYSPSLARNWGQWGNGGQSDGLNGEFDKEAAKNRIPGVAKVGTIAELDAALDKACAVTICSNVGFDSPRDKDGFCARRGSWGHCMVVIGRRNGGRKGYLVQNSWGAYIKGDGPNSPNKYQDQPDGSFYVEPATMAAILRQGDSWALSADADFKGPALPEFVFNANERAPEPELTVIEPPVLPKEGGGIKPSDTLVEQLKPLTADEFLKLTRVEKPTPVAVAPVLKKAAPDYCPTCTVRRGVFRR